MNYIRYRKYDDSVCKYEGDDRTDTICLGYGGIAKIIKIVGMTQLRHLDLSNGQIEKIEGFENLANLYLLNLSCNGITKIEGLDNLKNLHKLDLSCNKITKIEGLNGLISLGDVRLWNNRIKRIDGLDNLTNLHCLWLSSNKIKKICGLDNLTNLRRLDVHNNSIKQIERLDNLTNLHLLDLSENKINKISGLMNLTNLDNLNLSINYIKKIDNLDNLTNLQHLDLENNKIEKIEGLDNLINLQYLGMSSNLIKKLEGLDNLINLQYLGMSSNLIKKLEGLDNLINLRELFMISNFITILPLSIMNHKNLIYLYIDADIPIDPIIQRFLNRNHIIGKRTIYDDQQNVHDSQINQQISRSLYRLMEEKLVITDDQTVREIIDDPILTQQVKQQIVEYTKIQDVHSVLNVTFMEALKYVWQIIRKHEHTNEIKKVFDQEMQDSICRCFTGRMSRLVNSLNGFDQRVVVRLSDQQEIANLIIAIRQKYSEIEQQLKMARIELTERGYDKQTIDEWIGYLE